MSERTLWLYGEHDAEVWTDDALSCVSPMPERIRLGTDGSRFYVLRMGLGDRLSPPFPSMWDLRGWLMCRGYTGQDAAFFVANTHGPIPDGLYEGPEAV